MVLSSKFVCVILPVVMFCLVVAINKSSDCVMCASVWTTSQVAHGRKLMRSGMNMKSFKSGMDGPPSGGNGKKMVTWELRAAPLGPDPLHHNGVNPKKPRAP